jgi:hypothetical protein
MIPTIVATAIGKSAILHRQTDVRLTCFADIQLLLDEQTDEGEDTDISAQNGISQMHSINLIISAGAEEWYPKGMKGHSDCCPRVGWKELRRQRTRRRCRRVLKFLVNVDNGTRAG